MHTELIVGKFRIHFESQKRRRLFVALFYVAAAVFCLSWCSFNPKGTIGAWILSGCMILVTVLAIIFTSIAGDVRGAPEAQFNLGNAYVQGQGVRKDYVQAAVW